MLALAVRVYGNFNVPFARQFILANQMNPDILMICTDSAFGCAYVNDFPWLYNVREGYMEFLAATPGAGWDAYFILKKMVEWAEIKGAGEFIMRPTHGISLAPFAKRLRFAPEAQGYSLKIDRKLH